MERKNCPNCGAVYEINEIKCPYCGTSYFDLSSLNLDNQEPFYLKIKVNGMVLTQLVKPTICQINMESNNVDIIGGTQQQKITTCTISTTVNYNLNFEAISNPKNNTLITIHK